LLFPHSSSARLLGSTVLGVRSRYNASDERNTASEELPDPEQLMELNPDCILEEEKL